MHFCFSCISRNQKHNLTKHIYELKHNTRYICGKHTKKVKKEKINPHIEERKPLKMGKHRLLRIAMITMNISVKNTKNCEKRYPHIDVLCSYINHTNLDPCIMKYGASSPL